MKRLLIALILIATFVGGERFFHFLTDGFYDHRVFTDLPNREEWDFSLPPPEGALTQTYHYLTSGGQSFVLVSDDGRYVLKFFKHHRWRKNRFSIHTKRRKENEKLREFTLASAMYAAKYFREESFVEYMHLNRGDDHLPILTCIDRIGRKHYFDLNKYQFVIQKKGCILSQRLIERKEQGDLEGARRDVRSVLDLLISCHHKGIKNGDPYMTRNFGLVGDKPVVIDSGAFCEYRGRNREPLSEYELRKAVAELLKWTKKYYPPLVEEIEGWIKSYYTRPLQGEDAGQDQVQAVPA